MLEGGNIPRIPWKGFHTPEELERSKSGLESVPEIKWVDYGTMVTKLIGNADTRLMPIKWDKVSSQLEMMEEDSIEDTLDLIVKNDGHRPEEGHALAQKMEEHILDIEANGRSVPGAVLDIVNMYRARFRENERH